MKTTVQDFKRDEKFARCSPVNLLYVAIPNGLLESSQIDGRWGILSQIKSGVVKCIRHPKLQHVSVDRTVHVLAQIAIRRHHFSAYDRAREFQKQAYDNENERTSRMRIGTAVNMVKSIVSGERTVEDAIAVYCGSRVRLPKWQIEELNKLCNSDADKTRMYHGVEWAD